ncbi:MAG: hypothetical protein IPN03_09675 [Holophagales bacterium]|nr:hypothetical protein [Holophagales bacterium]MBK9373980.1 hypothetical protein [Holophagales bacterium]
MELDDLKRQWEDQDRKLDVRLRLNARLLNDSVLAKADTATKALSRLLWLELALSVAAVLLTGSFLASHISEARFVIPAAGLHLSVIALIVASIRQLVAIGTLDYDAPIVGIQKRLESLRVERIRATKWTLLCSPLLWTPLLIVALKGVFGVDAYETCGAAFLIANLLFGVLVILLAVWTARRYASRMERSPFVQGLMRDLAGDSLNAAAGFLSSISRFEEEESHA